MIKNLPDDWEKKYNIGPVLMKTFVQKNLFVGICYKAVSFLNVGQTKGLGKLGPAGKNSVPFKDVWLYPIDKKFRALLKN